jgi:hypothetical protein
MHQKSLSSDGTVHNPGVESSSLSPATIMKISKPILAVSTPIGVAWAIVEAWRFHWYLAVLMVLLLTVIGGLLWMTLRTIHRERDAAGTDEAARR